MDIDLRQYDFFANFSDDEVSKIAKALVRRRFQPNEELILSSNKRRSILLIIEGSLKAYKNSPSGHQRVLLSVYSAGDVLGKECLFDETFDLFVITATKGTYIELNYELLLKVLGKPEIIASKSALNSSIKS